MDILLYTWLWITAGSFAGRLKHATTTHPISLYGLVIIVAGPLGFLLPVEK
jgi:hypothetical protein